MLLCPKPNVRNPDLIFQNNDVMNSFIFVIYGFKILKSNHLVPNWKQMPCTVMNNVYLMGVEMKCVVMESG